MVRATRRHAANLPRFGTSPSSRSGSEFGAVHVLLDHRHPVVRQIARQLELHARVVDRDVRRQDQRVAVALFPQAVDHRRHQAQHAARALEFHQRGPVGVEPVENLRVDRIRGLDPLLVVGVAALGRELLVLRAVEVGEGARDHVAVLELRWIGQRLEQPPPHDLKAFLGARRPPRGFDAAHDVAQPVERLAPALTAYLHVIGLRVRRTRGVRGGQADHQQAVLGELR